MRLISMTRRRKKLTDIRVLEDEPRTQFILQPVHFTADNAEKRLAVDQDLYTVLLYTFVEGSRFVNVFQVICQARAASVLNSHSYKFRFGLFQEFSQMRHGRGCNGMGAFLGRSFDFFAFCPAGCAVAVDADADFDCFSVSDSASVGLLFCASPSRSLTPCSCCRCQGALGGHFCDASAPAMLVSGIPVLRGGGGMSEGSECGRYEGAESVIRGRL
jgi:hypothetical protein